MGVADVMDVSGGRWRMAVDEETPGVRVTMDVRETGVTDLKDACVWGGGGRSAECIVIPSLLMSCVHTSQDIMDEPLADGDTDARKMSHEDLASAVVSDPSLLKALVSKHPELIAGLMEETQKEKEFESKFCVDPSHFHAYHKGINQRFHTLIGDTLYEFFDHEDYADMKKLLDETSTQEDAFVAFQSKVPVDDLLAQVKEQINEVFNDFKCDIKKKFLVPYFVKSAQIPSSRATESQVSTTPLPEKATPKKLSTPCQTTEKIVLRRANEEQESEDLTSLQDSEDSEEEEEEVSPKKSATKMLTSPPKIPATAKSPASSKPKTSAKRTPPQSDSPVEKKKRGRPRKGPTMDLQKGQVVRYFHPENNTWGNYTIAAKAGKDTITMTTARRALSAGSLLPQTS